MVVFLIDKEADERPDGSGVFGGLGPLPFFLLSFLFFLSPRSDSGCAWDCLVGSLARTVSEDGSTAVYLFDWC